jgi:protein ImuB
MPRITKATLLAENEQLLEKSLKSITRVKDLEAENLAKDAKIKTLEEALGRRERSRSRDRRSAVPLRLTQAALEVVCREFMHDPVVDEQRVVIAKQQQTIEALRRGEGPIGEVLLAALDALTEAAPQPLDPRVPVAEIAALQRFPQPIATTDAVREALKKLLLRCALALGTRGQGGRLFCLSLYRADGHVAHVRVETAEPQREAGVLLRLFDERIASLNDPLDPGFGYDLIRLAVPVAAPLAETQLGLEGGQLAETQLTELVDRLTARLGRGRIRRLMQADTHIPEQASFDLPLADSAPFAWPAPSPGEPPSRPFRLFDPPQPIEVLADVPDGPPRRFRWRARVHDVTAHEGPERIAAQWWRRKDGAGLTRDYWRVEVADGRRFWLFRHGLYARETDGPRWYLHGLFA